MKRGAGEKKGRKERKGCGREECGKRKGRKERDRCGGRSAGEEKGVKKKRGAGEHRKWRARTLARKKTEFF